MSYTLADFYQKQRLDMVFRENQKTKNLYQYGSYLPNLRYKNGVIYYHSSNVIKFKSSKSKSGYHYQSEFRISNLELNGQMNIYNNTYYIDIVPKFLDHGLEIHVKYFDTYDSLHPSEKAKIARAAEYQILGINMFKDYYQTKLNYDADFGLNDILYDQLQYSDNTELFSQLNDLPCEFTDESSENQDNKSEKLTETEHNEETYNYVD
jgi:hypothetical protein